MRQLCCALLIIILAASCRDKVICPTFQSTYILDDSVRNTYFSYLWYLNEDERATYVSERTSATPPDSLGDVVASASPTSGGVDYFAYTAEYKVLPRPVKTTKNGLAKRTPILPNLVRNIQMKTSPMENVLTPSASESVPSSENESKKPAESNAAPLDSTAAVAEVDSLSTPTADSTTVAKAVEKKKAPWEPFKYGFNPLDSMQPDQKYYFMKYGYLLQNAKPKEQPAEEGVADSASTERKGLKGLFKKKDKEPKEKKEKVPKEKKKKSAEEPVNDDATLPEEEEGDGF